MGVDGYSHSTLVDCVYMARYIGKKDGLIIGCLVLSILMLSRFMRFTLLNYKKAFRGCDPWGCGSFGSSRGSHSHRGLDFAVEPNENIYAPFPCKVVRHGYPYAGDYEYRLIEIQGTGGYSDYKAKIMYIKDFPAVGSVFNEKEVLCKADDITKKYSSSMTNHVHFELYAKGSLINPEIFF